MNVAKKPLVQSNITISKSENKDQSGIPPQAKISEYCSSFNLVPSKEECGLEQDRYQDYQLKPLFRNSRTITKLENKDQIYIAQQAKLSNSRGSFDSFLSQANGLERHRYQNYQLSYQLKAQHEKLEKYKELAENHITIVKEFEDTQAELIAIKAELKRERRENQRESSLLRGRIKLMKEEKCSSTEQSPVQTCDVFPESTKTLAAIDNDIIRERNLIPLILELKLQLAKAHGEADFDKLRLNRLTIERDVLRHQVEYGYKKRRWSSK